MSKLYWLLFLHQHDQSLATLPALHPLQAANCCRISRSGWRWFDVGDNCHVLVNQFHENFRSKTLGCKKIRSVFRDIKWCFNALWGLKVLNSYVRADLLYMVDLPHLRCFLICHSFDFQHRLTYNLQENGPTRLCRKKHDERSFVYPVNNSSSY